MVSRSSAQNAAEIAASFFLPESYCHNMSEIKAISPAASSHGLNKNTKGASSLSIAEPSSEEKGKTSVWRKLVGLVWDSVEGDPGYRRYVQRLDTFFLYGLSVCRSPLMNLSSLNT